MTYKVPCEDIIQQIEGSLRESTGYSREERFQALKTVSHGMKLVGRAIVNVLEDPSVSQYKGDEGINPLYHAHGFRNSMCQFTLGGDIKLNNMLERGRNLRSEVFVQSFDEGYQESELQYYPRNIEGEIETYSIDDQLELADKIAEVLEEVRERPLMDIDRMTRDDYNEVVQRIDMEYTRIENS